MAIRVGANGGSISEGKVAGLALEFVIAPESCEFPGAKLRLRGFGLLPCVGFHRAATLEEDSELGLVAGDPDFGKPHEYRWWGTDFDESFLEGLC